MARTKLVTGNWKMHGSSEYVKALSEALNALKCQSIEVVVSPPYCFLPLFENQNFGLAGQDVSAHEEGAFTGQVSATMLRQFGCDYVLIGHSERRTLLHECNVTVAKKVLAALAQSLKPIVCVGEPVEIYQQDRQQEYIARQINAVLDEVSESQIQHCVFAYEPVWAIGSGKAASPVYVQAMHTWIRTVIEEKYGNAAKDLRILYGGSVNKRNAKALFAQPDIDGGLIGGASLNASEFVDICKIAIGE